MVSRPTHTMHRKVCEGGSRPRDKKVGEWLCGWGLLHYEKVYGGWYIWARMRTVSGRIPWPPPPFAPSPCKSQKHVRPLGPVLFYLGMGETFSLEVVLWGPGKGMLYHVRTVGNGFNRCTNFVFAIHIDFTLDFPSCHSVFVLS